MRSTTSASIAARGIPSWIAVEGSCAYVLPPAARIAESPSVPSVPVPERTIPTASAPRAAASDRMNVSIGMGGRADSSRRCSLRWSPSRTSDVFGGITCTRPAATVIPSCTSATSSGEIASRAEESRLSCVGDRCWTMTTARFAFFRERGDELLQGIESARARTDRDDPRGAAALRESRRARIGRAPLVRPHPSRGLRRPYRPSCGSFDRPVRGCIVPGCALGPRLKWGRRMESRAAVTSAPGLHGARLAVACGTEARASALAASASARCASASWFDASRSSIRA